MRRSPSSWLTGGIASVSLAMTALVPAVATPSADAIPVDTRSGVATYTTEVHCGEAGDRVEFGITLFQDAGNRRAEASGSGNHVCTEPGAVTLVVEVRPLAGRLHPGPANYAFGGSYCMDAPPEDPDAPTCIDNFDGGTVRLVAATPQS